MMMIIPKEKRLLYYRIFVYLFIFLIIPQKLVAEEVIKKGDSLNLNKCLDIALKKHPQIIAAMNSLDVYKSRVGQSKSDYYPQIKWNSDLSRTSLPGKSPVSNEYSSSVSLNQNIFDFNRRGTQVDIQRLYLDSSRADLNDVMSNIKLGVKEAYYELLRSQRKRDITAETVKQFEKHLKTAKGFFDVGVKPKFDVTKAEVDLSNARLNLLKAENVVRIALVTMNNAMGMPDAPPYDVVDDVVYQKSSLDLGECLGKAYIARPDLQSLLLKKEAAQRALELAKKDYYPVLSGKAGYGWSGDDFPLQSGWNIGATLDLNLFTGYSTKYKINEAMANLEVLRANEKERRQTIRLEVEQSYTNLQEVPKRILTAEITLRQAEENLDLAEGRYNAGIGDPLEVTDALVAQSNAKTALFGELYDYKIAEAKLEKAMGDN